MPRRATVTGIERSIRELDEDLVEAIDEELRSRSLESFADIKRTTPVDTGRARNSWSINRDGSLVDVGEGGSGAPSGFLGPSSDPNDTIYITNGTDYIENLNNGNSRQAPAKFIEQALLRYFDSAVVDIVEN